MTWHLKDRELEKRLNDLLGANEFTEALNQASSLIGIKSTITVKFGPNTGHIKGSFRCYFEVDELINIGYDPHTWNEYPEVTPPEGVPMRVEIVVNGRRIGYFSVYKNGIWTTGLGNRISILNPSRMASHRISRFRFRPWED